MRDKKRPKGSLWSTTPIAALQTGDPEFLGGKATSPSASIYGGGHSKSRSNPPAMISQPETLTIEQDQLVAEVKEIYAGLVMVENKCEEVKESQAANSKRSTQQSNDRWNALVALHREMLFEHHDFFLPSQHSPERKHSAANQTPPYPAMTAENTTNGTRQLFAGIFEQRIAQNTSPQATGPPGYYQATTRDMNMNGNTAKSDAHFKPTAREGMFSVHCTFNGIQVEANADTGASDNLISRALANSMSLFPDPSTRSSLLLPSGKRILSPGRVKGRFKFENEETTHDISCRIIENSSHPLVLGSKFLRLTRTFTKHMHRLKRAVAVGASTFLNLLGDEQDLMPGYLNGSKCLAIPDSGSDITVVSGAYAKAHGFKIRRGRRYRRMVQFIDGSMQLTDGLVENLDWQFRAGEPPIRCNFHVMNKLPFDAILSNALIYEFNIFLKYEDMFLQSQPGQNESGIYNIRLAEKCRAEITQLEDSFIEDMTSDPPFTAEIVERETARRDMIRDRIVGLPEDQRQSQLDSEVTRQARFNEEWAKHRERMARNPPQSQINSAASPPPATASHNASHSLRIPNFWVNSGNAPAIQGCRQKPWLGWKMWK